MEKSHLNLSDYNQFLFKKGLQYQKTNFSSEKIINSGNHMYDYAHSFFGEDFQSIALFWYNIEV